TAFYWVFPRFTVGLLLRRPEFQAVAPYLGIFALAILGLALANVLVYYFVAIHRRRFVIGPLIGAAAFAFLLAHFHSNLREFTFSVTGAIDLMAVVLLGIYGVGRQSLARGPVPVG